ncbi:hypothetical protein [Vibrio cholerae]|uniref:hypothetical protein n=1 Tax=Vibrio cholerae TaxID=666 RepID=UPI00163D228D|nr:hypothetical protein [Vibrio cholerae]QYO71159.1 hypothetical protein KTC41_05980 [Vibrio cholerae]HBC3560803.1 hypothetical protein [Vibrio cholerae]
MHITKVDGALILYRASHGTHHGSKNALKSAKKQQNDDGKAKRFKNKEIGLARQKNCR